MTKRERVLAAIGRRAVDRPPVAFWRHVPDVDHTSQGLADAMLAFHRTWDLDLIKVMSSGVYCVEDWGCKVAYQGHPGGAKRCTEHGVKTVADWARLRPLDPGAGALGRELEAVRLVRKGRVDDAPILHTIFSPLTIATKLAGNLALHSIATAPDALRAALEVITETTARYAAAALGAGADGLFFATQAANAEAVTEAVSAGLELPYARRVLDRVQGASALTLLHLHGRDVYWDAWTALPVHAVNWHDRLTAPTLADASRRFNGGLAAGLGESRTLLNGPARAVTEEVRDAIAQTRGVGLILTPGCVLPLAVPDAHLAAVVAAVLALAAPAPAADPPSERKTELRVAIPWTPENLDPTMNLSSIRAAVGASMFDSLVGRDASGRIVPELAESWKLIDDTTWQLRLRRGVVFHDGEPFNADAVRFTVQRVLDPEQKSPNRANIGEIARVDVLDDLTVNLVTKQAYAPLLNRLIDFPILPPRYAAEKGPAFALRPVGTGPFRFVALVKDEHLTVEAFDRHWRGAPKLQRIVFKPIPEPFTRSAALRNGEVDLIATVPPGLARELERVAGLRVPRVRQALNYASDVDAIIKTVLDGNGRRQEGPYTPNVFGYDASVRGYRPDPARARRLLAEAGYLLG